MIVGRLRIDDCGIRIAQLRDCQSPNSRSITQLAIVIALSLCPSVQARQSTADEVARAIVIGQAYTSGNVYVAGFVDDPQREWPARIATTSLRTPEPARPTADFIRVLVPDSEEQHSFTQKEDGGSAGPEDLFSTIDSMVVTDPNLALYRAATRTSRPLAIFGWNERLALIDISFGDAGKPRPVSATERVEIEAEKKSALPIDECTTVRQFLDSAEVMLTAKIAKSNFSIRLSRYQNPGCAGHLAEIYVLDVLEPGREPRRFQFSHYVGLL